MAPEAGDQRLVDFFRWWDRIVADPDDAWLAVPWVARHRCELGAAEELLRAELPGRTLSHTDLRADNIVITAERTWFVDWGHAQNAASWVDAGLLLADVVGSGADLDDGGEVDVSALIDLHLGDRAGYDTVWWLMLGLAGAMHGLSQQPSPPGLPTIRSWQAVTGQTLLDWCVRSSDLRSVVPAASVSGRFRMHD